MNPWQQIKLTFRTLASVLRGQALAPSGYRPIASAVRTPEETEVLLAETPGAKPAKAKIDLSVAAAKPAPVDADKVPAFSRST
jgi:geranylgeranyl reductase